MIEEKNPWKYSAFQETSIGLKLLGYAGSVKELGEKYGKNLNLKIWNRTKGEWI